MLGDPGSGKSTFVRQLAAWLAAHVRVHGDSLPDGWHTPSLPLLVTLRDVAPGLAAVNLNDPPTPEQNLALVEVVRAQVGRALAAFHAEACSARAEHALVDGDVLLIFDGLDEVPEEQRKMVARARASMEYPNLARIIVTCRMLVRAMPCWPASQRTRSPLIPAKVERFVDGWYRAQVALARMDEATAAPVSPICGRSLGPALKELAANPMLLTTMAVIHQREVGLPSERVSMIWP
ncbi:MAG: hypothetical protein R2854_18885 [Caldilineaceae bacterium]